MLAAVPELTVGGKSLLIRAISGEQITFTRFRIGNGKLEDTAPENLTDLINPVIEFGIAEVNTSKEGYIELTGKFDSEDIQSDFRWRELGVYAHGQDGKEMLYAYANDGDNAPMLKANESNVFIEQSVSLIVAIGEAEHVTALISPSAMYASKQEFDDHIKSYGNPHKLKPSDIGLGNVKDVAPEDMAPAWTMPKQTATQEITSGETMSAMLGKIARAIKNLISHLSDYKNPHHVTLVQLGGATKEHNHSATDITSGVLSIGRGGTGVNSTEGLKNALGIPALSEHTSNQSNPHNVTLTQLGGATKEHNHSAADVTSGVLTVERGGTGVNSIEGLKNLLGQYVIGWYEGDGAAKRHIDLGFEPQAVICSGPHAGTNVSIALRGYPVVTINDANKPYQTDWEDDYTLLMIDADGFFVNGLTDVTNTLYQATNKSGVIYRYIAYR